MAINVSVPIGLQRPVEVHLQIPFSFTINQWKMINNASCNLVLIDYAYSIDVNISELRQVDNANRALPWLTLPGVADVKVMLDEQTEVSKESGNNYPVKVVLHLLAGEFSLGVHQFC